MSLETNSFEFGEFLLDTREKVLLRDGKPLSITPKAFQVLQILVENHGHVVEREKILNAVWADSFVEEGNLTFTVRLLRKVLDDSKQNPRFIETVPKRGYRFIAEINENSASDLPVLENKKEDIAGLSPKPVLLIAISVIAVISFLVIGFVWYKGENVLFSNKSKFVRLTTTGKVTIAAISPNGEYLIFAQKEGSGESLWQQQTGTGEVKQILPAQEVEFVGLTVSPDNNFAYYSVFSQNSAVQPLFRLSIQGGTPEPISGPDTASSISFSPDGKKFAYTESFSSLKESHLKIADADGSNQQTLIKAKNNQRRFSSYKVSSVAWSPDGETIACAVEEFTENISSYRILLVDPKDGSEHYLSEKRWDSVDDIVWKDAGNLAVINLSPNLSVSQIWQISRQTGEAEQLTHESNNYQWLSSANGKLYAVQKKVFSSLHVADSVKNSQSFQAKQILGESGTIDNISWSLDGKIYYNSWSSGKNEIWQVNSNGTAPHQLTKDSNLFQSFAVSPTDNQIVFPARHNGKIYLSIADSNGENIHPLTDGINDISPVFSPDGKAVIYQSGLGYSTLWQVSPEGNSPPVQLTGYLASNPSVSSDGQKIAFHFIDYGKINPNWKLGLINSKNRQLLNKVDFPLPISERKSVWQPKTDILTMIFYNGGTAGILQLSTVDGKFQTIENIGSGKVTSFDWSADGNRFAFAQNIETNDVISIW